MRRLVGNQNEMNYKVLYESAMRKIAKLEQELAETKEELRIEQIVADGMNDCVQQFREELRKANQKAQLYDLLLCDTMVAYYSGEECANFQEIIDEHSALKEGKTTGYEYTGNKEDQAKLLAGYELINNEEETDMNIDNNDVQAMWDSLTQEEKERLVKQFMDGTEELRNRFREMNKQYIETQKRIDKLISKYDSIEVDEEI